MSKVTGPLLSLDASGKFADTLVFQNGRGGTKIARLKKDPKNPKTIGQSAQRQKLGLGGKAIKAIDKNSDGEVFLRTKATGEGTFATVVSASVITTFEDVKAYVGNSANSEVVAAFQTAAENKGVEGIREFAPTLPALNAAHTLIGLYLAFSRNGSTTLIKSLATLAAADAATLISHITV